MRREPGRARHDRRRAPPGRDRTRPDRHKAWRSRMNRYVIPAVALFVTAGVAIAAEVKSGLDKGESPQAFNVKDITGPNKGTSLCYRCQYGAKPVTVVFTREVNDEVAGLVQQLDEKVGAN